MTSLASGTGGLEPKALGHEAGGLQPHWPPQVPKPRRRPSLGSDARHRAPVVIPGFAEYGLIFVYKPAVFSLCINRQFSFFFLLFCSQQMTSGNVLAYMPMQSSLASGLCDDSERKDGIRRRAGQLLFANCRASRLA